MCMEVARQGTTGEAKTYGSFLRLKLDETRNDSGEIKYRAHVQSSGWQDWKTNTAVAGTVGAAKNGSHKNLNLRENGSMYDVYYRKICETYGCLTGKKMER